jgi:hypothetical protein
VVSGNSSDLQRFFFPCLEILWERDDRCRVSTPAEPVQASLLEPATHSLEVMERRRGGRGGGGGGSKGKVMEKVDVHSLTFSRGTSVAEPRFCSAKIAPQGPRRDPRSADFFEPFSLERALFLFFF